MSFLSEHPNSSFNDPNGMNIFLLMGFILGALYLLGSNGDPVPEITWNTFYREMLMTGEVGNKLILIARQKVLELIAAKLIKCTKVL
jgi:hypothetical protein